MFFIPPVRLIDSFWDATLARVPNRVATLREMKERGELRRMLGVREVVLDRASQHLAVCKDSQDTVRNCRVLRNVSIALSGAWLALTLVVSLYAPSPTTVSRTHSRAAKVVRSPAFQRLFPRVFRSVAWPALFSLVAWVTNKIQNAFFYTYTKEKLQRDLKRIPEKIWADSE